MLKYLDKDLISRLLLGVAATVIFNASALGNDYEYEDDELLILEPKIQNYAVDDYAYIYEKSGKKFISLSQLASYTGFKYEKKGESYDISWALSPKNVVINPQQRTVEVDNTTQPLEPNDINYFEDTLFVSFDFLKRIFNIDVEIDYLNMGIKISSDQNFPTTVKKNLEKNRAGGLYSYKRESYKDYEFDNRWFSTPVLDVSLTKGWSRNETSTTNSDSYALNFAGMLGGLDVTAYVSGNSGNDRKPTVRLNGSREFLGEPANPLHLKKMEIGDVSGLSNSYFTSSSFGRGVSFSSFKDLILSADKTIDITGPLQEGWQVELYWNEQLMGYRQSGVAGRYNFENLPVSYGLNTFKLVFYGPYGETRTEYKRYYSGTSPVKKGEFGYIINAYEPNRYLIEDNRDIAESDKNSKPIFETTAYYGITDNLTVMSSYTQTPDYEKTDQQNFGMVGAQYAINGMSLQYNLERNLDTNKTGQHVEAQGDIYIGTLYAAADNFNKIHSPISSTGNDYIENQYEARFNGMFFMNMPYYLSYRFGNYEVEDKTFHTISSRISKQLPKSINLTLDNSYSRISDSDEIKDDLQFGVYKWWGKFSSEAWVTYEIKPNNEFKDLRLRGDWSAGRRTYFSAEYTRDLQYDTDTLSLSAGKVFDFGGLSLTFRTDGKDEVSTYLTYNISFAKEPDKFSGFATGNSRFGETGTIYATVKDENGLPLEGVGLNANGLEKEVYTDENGNALLMDMQTYEKTTLIVDNETLPDVALIPDTPENKLVLRPGTLRPLNITFTHKGAVEGKVENVYNAMMFGYEVAVLDENGNKGPSTFTDTEGYFILEGVNYGKHNIAVLKDGIKLAEIKNVDVDDISVYIEKEIKLARRPQKYNNKDENTDNESAKTDEDNSLEN